MDIIPNEIFYYHIMKHCGGWAYLLGLTCRRFNAFNLSKLDFYQSLLVPESPLASAFYPANLNDFLQDIVLSRRLNLIIIVGKYIDSPSKHLKAAGLTREKFVKTALRNRNFNTALLASNFLPSVVYNLIVKMNDLDLLKWVINTSYHNNIRRSRLYNISIIATRRGKIDTLEELKKMGCVFDLMLAHYAKDILTQNYLIKNGCFPCKKCQHSNES